MGDQVRKTTPEHIKKICNNWIGLSRSEAANLWADAHDIDGKMIWTPAQLFQEIERRLRERNA